jgi:hypothetical protein
VAGAVRAALIGVMPARLVVYCGTPLRVTGWLKTMVIVVVALVTLTMPIGTVGTGRLTLFLRRLARWLADFLIELGICFSSC